MSAIDSVMGNTFGKAAVIDFGIQWALWVVASALKTEKFYDLAGKCSVLYSYVTNLFVTNSVKKHIKHEKLTVCHDPTAKSFHAC